MKLWKRETGPDPELLALRSALDAAQQDLTWAYRRFDEAVDPELVESSCYEISAVKARCDYLLRQIKERTAVAACGREEGTWV